MNTYRIDEKGNVYEYDEQEQRYTLVGKLNGRTKEQFIEQHERFEQRELYM